MSNLHENKFFGDSDFLAALGLASGSSSAAVVTFTQLTGLTGDSPAQTSVYRADLTGVLVGNLQSISITDASFFLGGAPGQFSGFDLDAIKLSYTSVATAAAAALLVGEPVLDFTGGSIFTPGTQRDPVDPKLFGTGPGGNTVDDTVATLGAFDADSSTTTPDGFLSMGDGGVLSLNLTAPRDVTGLFLYIGEVGDNGEVAAGSITVSEQRVPEGGSTLVLLGIALAGLARLARFGKN